MLGVVGTKCLPNCSAAKQLPQSSPRHSHIAKLRSAFMLMSGGSQGLAHLCASTGVQGLFDPISTKKCLENYFQTHRTRETSISFHPSLWNMHQSSIETDTLQNRRGGLLARGQPPGLPSQLSPMAIDHSSPLQQQGLPQIHTAFPFPFDLFTFFLSPERPAPLYSIAHEKQNARTFCHFIFHEPEGIFMSNFLSSFLIIVSTGTCFFRRAWTTG